MNPVNENELRDRALNGTERLSRTLHEHETELSEKADMSEGLELVRRARDAADQVKRLLAGPPQTPSSRDNS